MNGITTNELVDSTRGHALIVSSNNETISSIEKMLAPSSIFSLVATSDEQAFSLLKNQNIFCILVESGVSSAPCKRFIRDLRGIIGNSYIPIVILACTEDIDQLAYCMSAGCDDILFKPFTALALNHRIESFERTRELKKLYKDSLNEQIVAKRILANAIDERSLKFKDIEFLNRSKAIFSGDLFISARHPDGSLNIMLADFTGHGLPSSVCSLPVADVFSTMTEKGFELAYILENINNKLCTLLPTRMFMACSVVNISSDLKQANVWNAGMPDIYLRDFKTGEIKNKLTSENVPLGISETASNQYHLNIIALTSGDQFILCTDGLTESLNSAGEMFGEHRIEECLRINKKQPSIFTALVNDFDEFRGGVSSADDVSVACIPCVSTLLNTNNNDITKNIHIGCNQDNYWHWFIELGGSSLLDIDPINSFIDEINKISGYSENLDKLSEIMSKLYKNVIDDNDLNDKYNSSSENQSRKAYGNSSESFIRIGIKKIYHNGIPALLVHMEDSGKQLSQNDVICTAGNINELSDHIDDEPLVFELNKLSASSDVGNRLEAIIFEHDSLVSVYG